MNIRFNFSPEQKEYWVGNKELIQKIIQSIEQSDDGKHAVIDISDEEFTKFISEGKPIKIGSINILTVPDSPVTI